jgi:small subunit ribosomal protein S16
MVKLRLARAGAKKKPYYRIVAADERYPRDGRFLEQIGTYDPRINPAKVVLIKDALDKWLKCGAVLTETVGHLVKNHQEGKISLAARHRTAAVQKASAALATKSRLARKSRKVATRKASKTKK